MKTKKSRPSTGRVSHTLHSTFSSGLSAHHLKRYTPNPSKKYTCLSYFDYILRRVRSRRKGLLSHQLLSNPSKLQFLPSMRYILQNIFHAPSLTFNTSYLLQHHQALTNSLKQEDQCFANIAQLQSTHSESKSTDFEPLP